MQPPAHQGQREDARLITPMEWKRLVRYGQVFWLMASHACGAFVQAVLEIGFALSLMGVVDALAGGMPATGELPTAVPAAMGPFAAILAGLALVTGVNTWMSGRIAAKAGFSIRARAARQFAFLHYEAAEALPDGTWQTRLTAGLQPVLDWMSRDRAQVVLHATKFVLAAVWLWRMNPWLMLAALLVIPVFVWLSGRTGNALAPLMEALIVRQTHVNGLLSELREGLPVVKAFRLAGRVSNGFRQSLATLYDSAARLEWRKALVMFFEIFLNYVPFIGTFLLGGYFAVQGKLSPGGILAFLQLVSCLAEPAATFPMLLSKRSMAMGAGAGVLSCMEPAASGTQANLDTDEGAQAVRSQPEPASAETNRLRSVVEPGDAHANRTRSVMEPGDAHTNPAFGMAGYRLEDVTVRRGGRTALSGIQLVIRPGEVVALVGGSGSGKTTLLHVLAGLLKPDTGNVTLLGSPIDRHQRDRHRPDSMQSDENQIDRSLNLEEADPTVVLREVSALVTQQPLLFPWSLYENLRCVRPDVSLPEIREALHAAGAHWLLEGSVEPEVLMARLGVDANTLSGGQAQRIAIARALLKQAPVLLMDEPTSALDADAGADIGRLVSSIRGRKTVLVAAHQPDSIRVADHVVLLNNGRIMASGTHASLLQDHAGYRRIWREMGMPTSDDGLPNTIGEVAE